MTHPETVDGDLPAALKRLDTAVSALTDPKPHTLDDNRIAWTDSLYDQLVGEIPGRQGTGEGVPRSLPPLCVDAADLKHEIDTAVAIWQADPGYDGDLTPENPPTPETVRRLKAFSLAGWRPQDVSRMHQAAGIIESWCDEITKLLDPPPRWTLPNPCPACDTRTVYRRDKAGEIVRQPALQLTEYGGCVCASCHYEWGPHRVLMLAGALGYELPKGVLE